MAFLKETKRSLRAYFLLVGVISVVVSFATISDLQTVNEQESMLGLNIPASWKAVIYYQIAMTIGLGIAYLAAGIKLQSALLTGAGWIKSMLIASIVLLVIDAILVTSILGELGGGSNSAGRVVFGSLIALYLLHNVRRLSHEAQNPPPPTVA